MPRIVIHPGKSNAELEAERRQAFFNLSMEERVRQTFQLIALTELFRSGSGLPRKSVFIRKIE